LEYPYLRMGGTVANLSYQRIAIASHMYALTTYFVNNLWPIPQSTIDRKIQDCKIGTKSWLEQGKSEIFLVKISALLTSGFSEIFRVDIFF